MSYTGTYTGNEPLYNYFQFGGGILIQANQFSAISGCPYLDTTLVSLNLNYSQGVSDLPSSWLLNRVAPTGIEIVFENFNNYNVFSNVSQALQLFSTNIVVPRKTFLYHGNSITINPIVTEFLGNKYSDISMALNSDN